MPIIYLSKVEENKDKYPDKDFIALYVKKSDDNWLVFPWELKDEPVEDNILRICQYYKIKEAKNIQDLIFNYENR